MNREATAVNTTLEAGLDVLECLAASKDPLGVAEIARRVERDRSNTFRILRSLVGRRYVRQETGSRRYALGPPLPVLLKEPAVWWPTIKLEKLEMT